MSFQINSNPQNAKRVRQEYKHHRQAENQGTHRPPLHARNLKFHVHEVGND